MSLVEDSSSPEDICGDGSVLKTVLVEGGGDVSGQGAKVSIKYSLSLHDSYSDPFDTSEKRKDGILQFTLGKRKVLHGLELAARSMKLGEKSRFQVTPSYAFGAIGLKRKSVPPNAIIYMTVEMIDIQGGEKQKSWLDMTPLERFEKASKMKDEGNKHYKETKLDRAIEKYFQCIRSLANIFDKPAPKPADTPEEETTEAETVKQDGDTNPNSTETEENGDAAEFVEGNVVQSENGEKEPTSDTTSQVSDAVPDVATPAPVTNDTEVVEVIDATAGTSTSENPVANGEQEGQGEEKKPSSAEVAPETKEEQEPIDKENSDPLENEVEELRVTTLNNVSLCYIKMKKFKEAAETASVSLKINPENSKAFYYRGRALASMSQWENARSDLVTAAKLQPKSVGIRVEIQKLDKKIQQFKELEKRRAAAMFT